MRIDDDGRFRILRRLNKPGVIDFLLWTSDYGSPNGGILSPQPWEVPVNPTPSPRASHSPRPSAIPLDVLSALTGTACTESIRVVVESAEIERDLVFKLALIDRFGLSEALIYEAALGRFTEALSKDAGPIRCITTNEFIGGNVTTCKLIENTHTTLKKMDLVRTLILY